MCVCVCVYIYNKGRCLYNFIWILLSFMTSALILGWSW